MSICSSEDGFKWLESILREGQRSFKGEDGGKEKKMDMYLKGN
jgi:hypothetical protein